MGNHQPIAKHHMLPLAAAALVAVAVAAAPAAAAPAISSVSGCSDDGTGLTSSCPSAGSISITITGTNFGADQGFVRVDGNSCSPTAWSDSEVVCTLPEGTGRSRLVSVEDVSQVTSPPVRALSYADPSISSVEGCDAAGCARGGGNVLTINGQNFGSSGARVLIGGEDCDDDGAADSHTRITCVSPAGSGMKPVRVITAGAGSSLEDPEIPYAQCAPGTRVSGSSCVACEVGFYSADSDAPACQACPSGTVASSTGSSACTPCDAGTFAPYPGATACQPCADGSSSTAGSTTCLEHDTMQCWKAKDLKNPAAFEPSELTVGDEFDASAGVSVKKLALVCLPSSVASSGVTDPEAYQCCYKSSGEKLDPPVTGTLTDAIGGSLSFEASKRDLTCSPCRIGL